jgi:hypothetical protein
MRNIIKNKLVFLVLMLISFSAWPRAIIEARLSVFLEKSDNAEIVQIIAASICNREKTECLGQFQYQIKFEELLYGAKTNAQVYYSDYDVSVGSYALIFSKNDLSKNNKSFSYYDHFYKLKKTVQMPPSKDSIPPSRGHPWIAVAGSGGLPNLCIWKMQELWCRSFYSIW